MKLPKISRSIYLIFALLFTLQSTWHVVSNAAQVTSKVINVGSNSLTVTLSAASASRAYLEYGYSKGKYPEKTAIISIPKGKSTSITIQGLKPDSTIYFRVRYTIGTGKTFLTSQATITKTSNSNNEEYIFAVQADPHMDQASSAEVYRSTLSQIVKSEPAFMMDLGDIFMTDKLQDKSETNIRNRFQMMKDFYSILGNIPYYFTLGNHDGELGYSNFNTKKYRQEYFPDQTGDLAYYSFTSPDALHVVLDIFTYTTVNPKVDGWQWTLGKNQYDWLKTTLENSSAKHKFIYVHHLLYGNAQSRGGVEVAKFNEWGGLNIDNTEGFSINRPNFDKPVHKLLVENGVDIVFKGHDHIYVKQELDGIIYQTLPQPSHPGTKDSSAAEYGYLSGKAIGGSGFLKVTTNKEGIKVEFIKYDGTVLDTYTKI